jgi:hypothetical protein
MASKQRSFLGIIYYAKDDSTQAVEKVAGRRRTTLSSWMVLISWLVSIALVGASLFASPHLREFIGQAGGVGGPLAVFFIVSVVCGWPWLLAFIAGDSSGQKVRAVAFAVIAVVIAAHTAVSISGAPSEGVGYSLILGIFLVWLCYPVLRVLSPK